MHDRVAEAHDDPALAGDNRSLKRWGIIVLIVALAIVAIGISRRMSAHHALAETAADAAIPTVKTVRPKHGSAAGALVLPGDIAAYNSAPIYARANGYVRRWLVDIGDHVRAGQPLAVLDAPEVDQQLAQADADYRTALANEQLAASTAKRWKTMLAQDAVSQQESDEKAGDYAAKRALTNAALANLKRLRAMQGFETLTAPFAGVVTSRSAQIGALVMAGTSAAQPLFTVSDMRRVRIYVRVPQDKSAMLKQGMPVTLTVPEYPGRTFNAVLTRTADAVDPHSGTELIELQADNPDGALKPGGYAQASFALAGSSSGVELPSSALIFGAQGPRVAIVDNQDHVQLRKVTIGQDDGAMVQIASGLAGDERVIDSPPDAIAAGDVVHVQPSGEGKAANAHR